MRAIFYNGKMYGGDTGGSGDDGVQFTLERITLSASGWVAGTNEYTQTVSLSATVKSNSKVDLQADTSTVMQLISDYVVGLYAENRNGTVIIHAIENAPSVDITLQCTVSNVSSLASPSLEVTALPTVTEYDDSNVGTSNVYTGSGLVVTFTDEYGNDTNVTSSCTYTISTGGGAPTAITGNYTFPSNPTDENVIYTVAVKYYSSAHERYFETSFDLTLKPDIAEEEPAL